MHSQNKINIKLLLPIFFVTVLILLPFFIFNNGIVKYEESTGGANNPDSLKEEELLSMIDKIGPEKAYVEFKKSISVISLNQRHIAAHLFGKVLYRQGGVKNLVFCDEYLNFACFHGFFIMAIDDVGPSVTKDLNLVCITSDTKLKESSCRHGIGHGLMEYNGHSLDGVKRALSDCDNKVYFPNNFGCPSGVLMGFNFPNLANSSNIKLTKQDTIFSNPYFPCTDITEKYRNLCYSELPQLWLKIFNSDYGKIGKLCKNISNDIDREKCYWGLGNDEISNLEYDIKGVISACKEMPDHEGELLCLSGATYALSVYPPTKKFTEDICKTLPNVLFDECINKAGLIQNNEKSF